VDVDKLVVFLCGDEGFESVRWGGYPLWVSETTTKVYDISDRAAPILEREITVDGYLFNSRMIGGYLYVVICKPAYLNSSREIELPTICFAGREVNVDASAVYYINYSDYSYTFTNIIAVDMQDVEHEFTSETFLLGSACSMCVFKDSIYIASPVHAESPYEGFEGANIHKINVRRGEITYVAQGVVPGRVLNQFSMDEHERYLVVTTTGHVWAGGAESRNNLYILNSTLAIIGGWRVWHPARRSTLRGLLVAGATS